MKLKRYAIPVGTQMLVEFNGYDYVPEAWSTIPFILSEKTVREYKTDVLPYIHHKNFMLSFIVKEHRNENTCFMVNTSHLIEI